jgi:uncharacterized membrane protein YgaE (UPF0421/DUF939 family)
MPFSRISLEDMRRTLAHALCTSVAAVASLLVAQQFGLPESYWAAITTLVIMQSTLGATLAVSGQRLAGTAIGAAFGAGLVRLFHPGVFLFGAAVFVLGVVCDVARLDRAAYRFAGITLAIVMLINRTQPAWIVAAHRFFEVAIGIIVGLLLTSLWPQPERQDALIH